MELIALKWGECPQLKLNDDVAVFLGEETSTSPSLYL